MRIRHLAAAACATSLLLLGLPAVSTAAPAQGGVIAAYTLMAPRSTAASGLVARAVLAGGVPCPDLVVVREVGDRLGARTVRMTQRVAPATTGAAFTSITVCSAHVPVDAVGASVAGHEIPARLPAQVRRLAVFGDTGCRIKGGTVQDCASPEEWPLALVSDAISRDRPDAVLFAGDFFYREAACPPKDDDRCGSSPPPIGSLPITDSAYGWIADVLLPMGPMLAAAPLAMVRGNHEACFRGGNGYFLMFDPLDGTEGTCAPVAGPSGLVAATTLPGPTYALDLPVSAGRTLRLAMVDSAGGSDTSVTPFAAVQRPSYERAAALAARTPGRESWLVTHRPLYGYVTTEFASPGQPFNPWTSADQTAASQGLLGGFDLVVSSHIHIAQSVQLPGLPGQLVLGNGGTELDPATGYPLPGTPPIAGYPTPAWGWMAAEFGYALATPNAQRGSWRFSMRDVTGTEFARCGLLRTQIYCADTP